MGSDLKNAIQKVREELGLNAVILSSSRSNDGNDGNDGVEVVAGIDYNESEIFKPKKNTSLIQTHPISNASNCSSSVATPSITSEPHSKHQSQTVTPSESQKAHTDSNHFNQMDINSHKVTALRQEIGMMRHLLENELAGLAWGDKKRRDPNQVELLNRLTNLGFSPGFSKEFSKKIKTKNRTMQTVWKNTLDKLIKQVFVMERSILETGGVVTLLGSTGVGKTMTAAKLAAQYALKFGADQVALVSSDCYRIAAQDQLKVYSKIMGVSFRTVDKTHSLSSILNRLRQKKLIVIDTAGLSQRDERLIEQQKMLQSKHRKIKKVLVLSATAQNNVIEENISIFKEHYDLDGCILTKLDECTGLGEVLSAVIRTKLTMVYVSNGQSVPEDLIVVKPENIIQNMLNFSKQYQYEITDETLAMAFSEE